MADDDKTDDKTTTEPKKPAVSFDTEGDFLHAVDKKAAQKVRAAEKTARDAVLAELGVEGDDDIAALKALRDTSTKSKTELEQLASANKKLARDLEAAQKAAAELQGFKIKTVKDGALRKHAGKVRDFDDLIAHVSSKVTILDDGSVDEKSLEAEVESLLKAKPHLKAPDFKAGAGTQPHGTKDDTRKPNGKPPSPTQVLADEMLRIHREGNRS